MKVIFFFILACVLLSCVNASDVLVKKLDKRQAKKTTTTTVPTTTTTTTRKILSDCPNPYVNKCGVTCCQGVQHCCVNDPTRCCWPSPF
jgi:hypothetical protein